MNKSQYVDSLHLERSLPCLISPQVKVIFNSFLLSLLYDAK